MSYMLGVRIEYGFICRIFFLFIFCDNTLFVEIWFREFLGKLII